MFSRVVNRRSCGRRAPCTAVGTIQKLTNAGVDDHVRVDALIFETMVNGCALAGTALRLTSDNPGRNYLAAGRAITSILSSGMPQLASDFRGGRPRPGGHSRKLPLW